MNRASSAGLDLGYQRGLRSGNPARGGTFADGLEAELLRRVDHRPLGALRCSRRLGQDVLVPCLWEAVEPADIGIRSVRDHPSGWRQ